MRNQKNRKVKNIPTIQPPQEVMRPEIGIKILNKLSPLYKKLNKKKTQNKTTLSKIRKLARAVLYALSEYRRADYVSKAAKVQWKKSDLSKNKKNDLFNLTPTWARSSNRKKIYEVLDSLILEHCNPLSELADEFLSLNKTINKNTLKRKLKTCWIIKNTENRKLDANGYKNTRPGGWKKCYKTCHIHVVNCKGKSIC